MAISAYVLLLLLFLQKIYKPKNSNFLAFFLRIIPPTTIAIAIGLYARPFISIPYPFLKGAVIGSVCGGIYLVLVLVFQIQEAKEVFQKIQQKIRRKR